MAIEERPPWDVYGIRDRNRMLCNAVVDILGLNKRQGWENLRRQLRNEQVRKVHEILSMLWPRDTNIADLLPRPDKRVFRAVYMGLIDPPNDSGEHNQCSRVRRRNCDSEPLSESVVHEARIQSDTISGRAQISDAQECERLVDATTVY